MNPNLEEVIDFFSECLQISLAKIPYNINIEEIRLRTFKPVILNLSNKSFFLSKNGNLIDVHKSVSPHFLIASKNDIAMSLKKMCNFSIHSYQNEINSGYITIRGGHRVGICGTAIYYKNSLKNIRDISSLNIRINHKINMIDTKILEIIRSNFLGILIIGKPSSGKTTVLRNISKEISSTLNNFGKMYKVTLVDERNEFSGTYMGIPQNDIGYADVLINYKKIDAISEAIRSLSPDVIICDEISTKEDVKAIKIGANSGVKFIASAHSDSIEKILNKIYINNLIKNHVFNKIILLDTHSPGSVKEVFDVP